MRYVRRLPKSGRYRQILATVWRAQRQWRCRRPHRPPSRPSSRCRDRSCRWAGPDVRHRGQTSCWRRRASGRQVGMRNINSRIEAPEITPCPRQPRFQRAGAWTMDRFASTPTAVLDVPISPAGARPRSSGVIRRTSGDAASRAMTLGLAVMANPLKIQKGVISLMGSPAAARKATTFALTCALCAAVALSSVTICWRRWVALLAWTAARSACCAASLSRGLGQKVLPVLAVAAVSASRAGRRVARILS